MITQKRKRLDNLEIYYIPNWIMQQTDNLYIHFLYRYNILGKRERIFNIELNRKKQKPTFNT